MSVGQISKIMGVSNNGMRFLEEEGLVDPRRNGENGYRRYGVHEQSVLYMYALYKQAGLKLGDIKEALQADPQDAADLIDSNVARLERELEEVKRHARAVKQLVEDASSSPSFSLEARPPLHCLRLQQGNAASAPSVWTPDLIEDHRPLIEDMPESFFGVLFTQAPTGTWDAERAIVTKEPVKGAAGHWGRIDYAPLDRCLRAVVRYPSSQAEASVIQESLAWARQHALNTDLSSPVVSRFLHLKKEADTIVYTLELWIPLVG